MLTGLHHAAGRRALMDQRPDDPLFAAAVDLQAFGLLNQALGPRLGNLVIDLVTAALIGALSSHSRPFWGLSFGDEHYLFTRAAFSEVDELVAAFETAIGDAASALDGEFAPIHVAWASRDTGRPLVLPTGVHGLLGRHRVLASAVASGARFDALARLAGDRDVRDHARAVQSECDGLLALTAHDLYDVVGRPGQWRLPFPRLRLALGIATRAAASLTAEQTIGSVLQELHRGIERARTDGVATLRRDFVLAPSAFCDVAPRDPGRETTRITSIRRLEKRIAGETDGFDSWQLLQLKPRWTLSALPRGRRTLTSLKALVSATGPGFADCLLGAGQIAFAKLAETLGHAVGASGNSLMLVVAGRSLTRSEVEQLLQRFQAACALPGGVVISGLEALTIEGHGRPTLLRAIAAAQTDLSTITRARTDGSSTLASLTESDLPTIERLIDGRRAAALESYEAQHRAASPAPGRRALATVQGAVDPRRDTLAIASTGSKRTAFRC